MADENEIVVEYNENSGAFEQGVPARNLTAAEWALVPSEVQRRLLASGVYRKVGAPASAKAKKESE